MFGKKKDEARSAPSPPPQPPPTPTGPPLWQDLPELCGHCGARVDQAEACRSPRPTCRFCSEPLPCNPVPPPAAPNAINTGYVGPFADLVNGAIGASMAQANQFFAPGGPAQLYAANATMTNGASVVDTKAYLLQSGAPARATITTWRDLGVDTGNGRVHSVSLAVPNSNHGTYPVETKTVIPPEVAPRLAQGMPVGVRVDRADPYTVLIVWSEA